MKKSKLHSPKAGILQPLYPDQAPVLNAPNSKAKSYFLRGAKQRRKLSDLKGSIISLNKGIESGFRTSECYWERGVALLNSKRLSSALCDFNLVVKLRPKEISGYFWRGWCYMEMRKWGPAIRDFKRCVDINPEAAVNLPRFSLGKAYYSSGKYRLAIKELWPALNAPWQQAMMPNKSVVYLNLGRVYKAWEKPEEALWCFEKARSIIPNRGRALALEMAKLKKRSIKAKAPRLPILHASLK